MPTYPIRAVSRMTGLSLDTLRAWERRYEAVVPGRGQRGRLYTDADVARLRTLGELVDRGYSIGAIASLGDAELASLVAAARSAPDTGGPPPAAADLLPLVRALDVFDLATLESMLNRHAVVLPPADLIFGFIVPVLREVGARWEAGRLRPSQEHIVSAIIRSVLGGLLRTVSPPDGSRTILFATPAGERHELGLLSAAVLAASAGVRAFYLGPDLPAAEIAYAATVTEADIVVVSLTTSNGVAARELKALSRVLRGVEVWVGGPEAPALLAVLGERARHLRDLADVARGFAVRRSRR
jgi:DNA-binding transcriptional MerR regulator